MFCVPSFPGPVPLQPAPALLQPAPGCKPAPWRSVPGVQLGRGGHPFACRGRVRRHAFHALAGAASAPPAWQQPACCCLGRAAALGFCAHWFNLIGRQQRASGRAVSKQCMSGDWTAPCPQPLMAHGLLCPVMLHLGLQQTQRHTRQPARRSIELHTTDHGSPQPPLSLQPPPSSAPHPRWPAHSCPLPPLPRTSDWWWLAHLAPAPAAQRAAVRPSGMLAVAVLEERPTSCCCCPASAPAAATGASPSAALSMATCSCRAASCASNLLVASAAVRLLLALQSISVLGQGTASTEQVRATAPQPLSPRAGCCM